MSLKIYIFWGRMEEIILSRERVVFNRNKQHAGRYGYVNISLDKFDQT